MIHPERYQLITQIARDLGVIVPDLLGSGELIDRIEPSRYLGTPGASGDRLGELSLRFILAELRNPGSDARPPFETVEYHPDLQTFEDLKVGMDVEGIITHLAGFGAFVDVGLPQEGLVHVSTLTDDYYYLDEPAHTLRGKRTKKGYRLGDRVRVEVVHVDLQRRQLDLRLAGERAEREKRGERARR